ncbi:hypothetical protein K737_301025 [Holospora undulata HU1]|uniref:Uncharacterized protein n=2 Tax=Holospora TaxID=44747 RepID=A0A061JHY4_9PROT|nr:hypothetical protein K737_301025 [Holospora undulata HU1]GAJ46086.1 hypothetical protein HE1_00408 [Holospora elegans E1]
MPFSVPILCLMVFSLGEWRKDKGVSPEAFKTFSMPWIL